jgi:flagellar basal-body rod protein FlgG
MTNAMGICELGMINDMLELNIISRNLAHANTAGYKRDISVTRSFESVLDRQIPVSEGYISLGRPAEPVPRVRAFIDRTPGALRHTANPLDVAIEGNAFFELVGTEGVRYARYGSFSRDAAGRLTNGQGLTVSGVEGEILLRGGEVTIDREGKINETGEYAGQLKLVTFDDLSTLEKAGGGTWAAPEGIKAVPVESVRVRQGYVEGSNVKAMDEMVRMMTTMRHFETTAAVIKGYDEIISTAISTIAEF